MIEKGLFAFLMMGGVWLGFVVVVVAVLGLVDLVQWVGRMLGL